MRSSTPCELITVAPSAKAPRNTRDSDSLPPCAVWTVRMTWASAGPLSSTPRRVAGVADRRRFVPHRLEQPRHAVPLGRRAHQHRNDVALAQFARQIVENEVLWRLEVAEQLLHQRVVVVGELLEHRIARVFLFLSHAGGDLDHLRGRRIRGRRTRARARDRQSRSRPRPPTPGSGAGAAACARRAAGVRASRAGFRSPDRSC